MKKSKKNMTWRQRHVLHADHPPFCEAGSLYETRAGMGRSRAAVAPRAAIRMPRPPDPRTGARRAQAPAIPRSDATTWPRGYRRGGVGGRSLVCALYGFIDKGRWNRRTSSTGHYGNQVFPVAAAQMPKAGAICRQNMIDKPCRNGACSRTCRMRFSAYACRRCARFHCAPIMH